MSTPYDPTADDILDNRGWETEGFVDVRTRDDNGRFKPKQIETQRYPKPLNKAELDAICVLEQRDKYKAHAEALAEALRDLRAALGTLNVRKDFSLMVAHASATKALVAWEGAQQ